jgi:hypothetical protein
MNYSCHFLFNHLGLPTLRNSTHFSNSNSLISVVLRCTHILLVLLFPSNWLFYIDAARTTQCRKHSSSCCRGVLPLSCLANSLGADHIENTSSAIRTRVCWSVAQYRAWRGPHRKRFSCIVDRVYVAGVA